MGKGNFVGRLSLFAFGCASTQGALQLQPQPQPLSQSLAQVPLTCAPVFSRQELVLLGLLILLITSLLMMVFEQAKKKDSRRKKKK